MAARIGRSLAAELLRAEVRRPLPARPEAAHYTMLARALMAEEANARTTGEAIAYLEKAIAANPLYVLALAHYASAISTASLSGWLAEDEQDVKVARAEEAIKRALKLEPDSAGLHLIHGGVLRAKGDHEQAIVAFRHVLLLNPTFANAHAELGRTLIDVGKAEEAIAEVQKAIALSPTDLSIYMWYYFAGLAAVHAGDHEGALAWLRKSHQANRLHDNTFRLMAVAYADAGQDHKAREMVREFLKMRPDATLDDWRRPNARSHPAVVAPRERIRATLQRLGVPESKVQAASRP
jgi:tetratricopeptide (TPR) repeat protein